MARSSTSLSSKSYWVQALVTITLVVFGEDWQLIRPANAVPIHLYGLNYNTRKGPDWDWDKCKSTTEILKDLTLLSRITTRLRLLSMTDCGQARMVLQVAKLLNMQLWLGLWVAPEDYVFEAERDELRNLLQEGLIDTDTVLGITVGSEAIYREDATVEQMIDHLNEVYELVLDSNLNLPVTIVDIAPEYNLSPALRSAVNVTMTNTFPYWEGIDIDFAVDDLQEDLDWLLGLPESRNKRFVLGETGWPSGGFIEGVGIAGPELQKQYFAECFCRIDVDNQWEYYWFTGIDNSWRQEQDPENTVEGTWGMLYSNLTLKPHFEDLEFVCSDGVKYSFAEVDWSIPDVTAAPAALDPASCQAHPECAGLFGDCCPSQFGTYLGCCDPDISQRVPTVAPVSPTVAPVIPTPKPVATPAPATPRPTTAKPVTQPPSTPQTPVPTKKTTDPPTESPVLMTLDPTEDVVATKSPTDVPTILETGDPTVSPTAATPAPSMATKPPTTAPTDAPSSETDTPTIANATTSSPTMDWNATNVPSPSPSTLSSIGPTPKPTVKVVTRPTDDDESFRAPTSQPASSNGAQSPESAAGRHSMRFTYMLWMYWAGIAIVSCCFTTSMLLL